MTLALKISFLNCSRYMAAVCILGMCQNCHLLERFEKEPSDILGNVKKRKKVQYEHIDNGKFKEIL